jgi:uncharacterized membrane protein
MNIIPQFFRRIFRKKPVQDLKKLEKKGTKHIKQTMKEIEREKLKDRGSRLIDAGTKSTPKKQHVKKIRKLARKARRIKKLFEK